MNFICLFISSHLLIIILQQNILFSNLKALVSLTGNPDNPFIHVVEKWCKNVAVCLTPQDFLSMLAHFSALYIKELILQLLIPN